MTVNLATRPLPERFDHLLKVISSRRFLSKQGLGNEVPFFICPFKPEEAVDMAKLQHQLSNKLEQGGVRTLNVNLYDIAIELLIERGLFDQILGLEASVSKAELKELLQGVLDSEKHLVPAMCQRMQAGEFDVMFISGVGEVFPYIRSHNVLNNLQRVAKEKPTVLFFPGSYTHSREYGASLDLFGRLHDDKYYRAFDIYQYEA